MRKIFKAHDVPKHKRENDKDFGIKHCVFTLHNF